MPPLWSEGRIGLELAALMRSRVWKGEGVEHADGQPVLLIPGFLAGDGSLGQMTQWLRRTGHRTSKAGIRSNIDCSNNAVERLGERLEVMAEARGQRVAIIGQSRGGNFAKVLAVRHPDLVSGIVTLGSPQLDPFAIHPLVRMQVFAVGTLGTIGLRGFFKHSCRTGECCERFWEDLHSPLRSDVGYLSVYSKLDGIVDWRACLDPHAEHLEITASHCGMAVSPRAYRAVAQALSEFREAGAPPRSRKPVRQPAPRLRSAA
jgi:hypothetical protein